MARIELAYSEEINDIVDAIEANELWIEGVLTDKKAFECIDEKCSAKITCRNMDTFAHSRKMIPHFIYSSQENMHSDMCEVYREFEEKEKTGNNNETKNKAKYIGAKVCFHMIRPENHRNIMHTNKETESETKGAKFEARKKYLYTTMRKSNYYWLNSMISYYVNSFFEKKTDIDSIEVDFGKGKTYNYKLNSFFKRISSEQEKTEKDAKNYVYYGKGILYPREDGGYDVVYEENFKESDKKIKCVVSKKMIDKCEYGKANKIKLFEANKGTEKFIYVLSSKVVDEKHNKIYLNISSLDCVAISDIELDVIDETKE